MEKEKLESMLIDYIDGKLNSVDKHHIEQELMKNPASYKLYEELKEVIQTLGKVSPVEPPASLTKSFEEMLQKEIGTSKEAKSIAMRPWWYAVAAGVALVITGISMGLFINNQQKNQERKVALQEERARTHQVVSMISDQQSAGTRIMGTKEAYNQESLNTEIYNVLIKTMNEDPNINVRLAAIDALIKFSDDPMVRKALIASLGKQTDPVIQIALIQLMVELKDKDAVRPLQNIIENESLLEAVKDEAHHGILVLS
jgi:hypothetical protein